MGFLLLKTDTGTEYKVFYPGSPHEVTIYEAEFYFLKLNAIELLPEGKWRVFVHGQYHSEHDNPISADIALKEALDGEL